eukprot:92416_1
MQQQLNSLRIDAGRIKHKHPITPHTEQTYDAVYSLRKHALTPPVVPISPGTSPLSLSPPYKSKPLLRSKTINPNQTWYVPIEHMKSKIYDDIAFEWQASIKEMKQCNHDQFMYVLSTVIDQMNDEIKESKDDSQLLYNKSFILSYLHFIQLHGMSFHESQPQFIDNIKDIVFDTKNDADTDFLTERVRQQYAHRLHKRIASFDVQSIPMHLKCRVSFSPSLPDKSLPQSIFSLMSTMNQYQNSSLLNQPSQNRNVMDQIDALDECNHKLSSLLCDNWTTTLHNRKQLWRHTIQSMKECTVLNMLYIFNWVLNHI